MPSQRIFACTLLLWCSLVLWTTSSEVTASAVDICSVLQHANETKHWSRDKLNRILNATFIFQNNVDVHFNGGISKHHSVVLQLCEPSSEVPIGKTRSIVSVASMRCGAAYATMFGPNSSSVHCEEVYDAVVEPCRGVWRTSNDTSFDADRLESVDCTFASVQFPSRSLVVTLRCGASGETGIVVATVGSNGTLISHMTGFILCSPPPESPTESRAPRFVLADVVAGVVSGAVLVAVIYHTGHNYLVRQYRGLDVLPCVRQLRRRAPQDPYEPLPQDDAQGEA